MWIDCPNPILFSCPTHHRGQFSSGLCVFCRPRNEEEVSERRQRRGREMVGNKQRCQRIGCDAFFTEEDNPDGSCRYHEGPIFHDGIKEWSCCKQKSHDFSLFLEIPGCKIGKHTTEKPVTKAAPSPNKPIPAPVAAKNLDGAEKLNCSRCRQGFFCSDHGSQVKQMVSKPKPMDTSSSPSDSAGTPPPQPPPPKVIDINEPQICKNKGCGKTFKEKDNHDTSCEFHPGPAVFHDRLKGWKCCDVHVKEFDEFLEIPPCAKGWHNANPTPRGFSFFVKCLAGCLSVALSLETLIRGVGQPV